MSLDGLKANFFLLHDITNGTPETPHSNPPSASFQSDPSSSRTLKLAHELDIVKALSFLSSYTNDPNKVSALCLTEQRDENGLVINIAINKGSTDELKQGLESLCQILINGSLKGKLSYVLCVPEP